MKLLLPEVRDVTAEDLPDLYDLPGPYLRAGFVASIDGAISISGRSGGLSSAADKAVFRALRTSCDAVIVGAGTAITEDYGPVRHPPEAAAWREAHGRTPDTPLVVVSRTGDIPADARFFGGPVIVAVPRGVAVPGFAGEVVQMGSLGELVSALKARGLTRLLCEGGPSLLTALLAAGVVDELCLTTSPKGVGVAPHLLGQLATPVDLRLLSLMHDDPGVLMARWAVDPA